MSGKWAMDDTFSKGGGGRGGGDPFAASSGSNLFGRDLLDVDPFDGHDSFGSDPDWGDSPKEEEMNRRKSESRGTEGQATKKRGKKPSRPSTTTTTSNRKSSTSSSTPRKSISPSACSRKSASSSQGEEGDGGNRGRGRSQSSNLSHGEVRSRSKSRTDGRGRSSSTGPGDQQGSSSGLRRGTKPDRSGRKPKQETSRKPTASEIDAAFNTSAFHTSFGSDPFASSATPAFNDDGGGFGDFDAAFPAPATEASNARNSASWNGDGFGEFANFESDVFLQPAGSSRSSGKRSSHIPSRSTHVDEGGLGGRPHPHGTRATRRSGSSSYEDEGEDVLSLNAREARASTGGSSGGTGLRQSRHRIDTPPTTRPSSGSNDRNSRLVHDRRRTDQGVSLGNFLGDVEKTKGPRKVRGSSSIHSAPAAVHQSSSHNSHSHATPHRSSMRSRAISGGNGWSHHSSHGRDDDDNDDDNNDHRTVGYDGAPSSKTGRRHMRRSTPQSPKPQVLKLDIAELAKQGYLEVQDGKMRLIIDVENDVY